MGSIQLDSDITKDTSSLSMFIEGFGRCSTGTSLSRSSCDVVANFMKASAHVFSTLDLNPYELLKQFSHLFEVKDHFFFTSGFVGVLYLFYHL